MSGKPVLTLILPECSNAEILAIVDANGILWDRGDEPEGTSKYKLADFLGLIDLVHSDNRDRTGLLSLFEFDPVPPTNEIIDLLVGWSCLTRPLSRVHDSFNDLLELRGACLAQAAFTFLSPVLALFRTAVKHDPQLKPLDEWLERWGWPEIVSAARAQDMAAYAIISGLAQVEDYDGVLCVRLLPERRTA